MQVCKWRKQVGPQGQKGVLGGGVLQLKEGGKRCYRGCSSLTHIVNCKSHYILLDGLCGATDTRMVPTENVTVTISLFLLQAQYRYESQFTSLAVSPAAVSPATAPPSYPLNPTEVPVLGGKRGGSLYPALSDFMGLDLSPQALAELAPEYALAVPQSVSGCYSNCKVKGKVPVPN